MTSFALPNIDPTIKHVGVSKLRGLSVSKLSAMQHTWVIQDNNTALAVLVRYEHYLAIQEEIKSLKGTIQTFNDEKERVSGYAKLKDANHGPVRPLGAVEAASSKIKDRKNDRKPDA